MKKQVNVNTIKHPSLGEGLVRLFTLIVLMAVAVITSTAANNTSSAAKKTLDKAAAKFNIKSGTTANFTITGDKIKQSGTISIKGNMFHATTPNAIVWYNGKTQWTYLKKNEEVNVSNPNAAKQASMNPYTFLTLYKKGYDMELLQTASGNQVHLKAQNQKSSIKEAFILVDANSNIKEVKMRQSSGWVTISVSNVKSSNLPDAIFTFNAKDYPKAEVIDLR